MASKLQIPVLSGIYADVTPQLRTSLPLNLVPVPIDSGISQGYLRPGDGLVSFGTGPGNDRGAINWNGTLYRVMGSILVSVSSSGVVTTLGDVGNDFTPVTFTYGFDRLAIASNDDLFYWDGTTLSQVTDPDLGIVLDVEWVDGYFMTTDGTNLVVTELNDPTSVNPLKYGSSEADPDPIKAILKLRNEVAALNRHTIEFFDNVGGDLFPFARIEGAQIEKGCVGTHACCIFQDTVAFLGGAFNEQVSVYLGVNGTANKVATHEIDTILADYTEAELAAANVEERKDGSHLFLYVHLPDRTLVYDAGASGELGTPVWFVLTSSATNYDQYRCQNMVRIYDKWIGGDPGGTSLSYLSKDVSSHLGEAVRWEFGTLIGYNEGAGAVIYDIELVALTGSIALGEDPSIATEYSLDGVTWSMPRTISAGTIGQRAKRLVWFGQGNMQNWRIQRFSGTSDAHVGFIRLNMNIDPLAW